MKSYYKSELKRLENGKYFKSIVINDGNGNHTKYLNLNSQSIPLLIKFLEKELKNAKVLEESDDK